VTAVGSGMYLWKRTEFWDLLAASSAEIGVVFFGLTILNGMLWGKITWGVFWRWEPRLTTTAVLFLTYIGYLAVRAVPASPRTRGTRCTCGAGARSCGPRTGPDPTRCGGPATPLRGCRGVEHR